MVASAKILSAEVETGTIKTFNDAERVYYDGYWIRYYDSSNTLALKKRLIDQLARRVFHHTESGINTPGRKLEEVRSHYEKEQNSAKKRVLAAMLAGALLNRGVDVLTKIVELEEIGVIIEKDNELIKTCGRCFLGALEYGKYIRPVRAKEGLEELWGEPFKAFTMPTDKFYETRYIKLAQTMRHIDTVSLRLTELFRGASSFMEVVPKIIELADCCKQVTETMRSDPAMIEIWPHYVSIADELRSFKARSKEGSTNAQRAMGRRGKELILAGVDLIDDMANMRIPLPKTTQSFLHKCDTFSERYGSRLKG
ncbi:MAG: hypothetical protein GKR93_15345 [Gammaproteobacteria bacterium]|nr:hypothetical protein [Gammaproteobacteria bacterium]